MLHSWNSGGDHWRCAPTMRRRTSSKSKKDTMKSHTLRLRVLKKVKALCDAGEMVKVFYFSFSCFANSYISYPSRSILFWETWASIFAAMGIYCSDKKCRDSRVLPVFWSWYTIEYYGRDTSRWHFCHMNDFLVYSWRLRLSSGWYELIMRSIRRDIPRMMAGAVHITTIHAHLCSIR